MGSSTALNVIMEKELEKRITDNLAESIRDMMAQSHASTNKMYSTQHGEILEKLKDIDKKVGENRDTLSDHIILDDERHTRTEKFFERIEPMIRLFDENQIIEMRIEKSTRKIVFYVSSISVIGATLIWIWTHIKN